MESEEIDAIIQKCKDLTRSQRIEVAREVGCHPDVVLRTLREGLSKQRGYWIRMKVLYALQKRIQNNSGTIP